MMIAKGLSIGLFGAVRKCLIPLLIKHLEEKGDEI
jgi:hypothetical protein